MEDKLKRALEIKKILDANKPLYDELEAITVELASQQAGTSVPVVVDGYYFSIVDNFAEKNTVFRPAAVKRFEMKIQTEEEIAYSRMSKSEKAAYTRRKKKEAQNG
jgi:hypothetical protein